MLGEGDGVKSTTICLVEHGFASLPVYCIRRLLELHIAETTVLTTAAKVNSEVRVVPRAMVVVWSDAFLRVLFIPPLSPASSKSQLEQLFFFFFASI